MKKKIFSVLIMLFVLVPSLLFVSCGKSSSFVGKTLIFSKVEVNGSLSKEYYEERNKLKSFTFEEDEMVFSDGVSEVSHHYKIENNKLYIKSIESTEFPTDHFAEISGNYLIVSETVAGGVVKVYFKAK